MELRRKDCLLTGAYVMATVQFVWCYLWLTRAYVSRIRMSADWRECRFRVGFSWHGLCGLLIRASRLDGSGNNLGDYHSGLVLQFLLKY